MKLLLKVIPFLFLIPSFASAGQGQVSAKLGTWAFDVSGTSNSTESASGIGAYAFEVGYSFFPKVLFVFGFNLVMSDLISGSAGYGLDLGARYYLLSDSGTYEQSSEFTDITIQEKWRPYIGLAMRQRLFGLALSTSYFGPGLSFGLDYSLTSKWFLTTEIRYDYLYGQGDTLAVQTNILLGAGLEF